MEKRKERIIKRIINISKKYERLPSTFLRLVTFSSIFNNPERFNKDYIEFQKFMNSELNYKLLFNPTFKGGIVCIQDLQC